MIRVRTVKVLSSSRLGYRGAFLLFLALVDVVYGWFLINPTSESQRTSAFQWRAHIMPPAAWGAIWLTVGIVLLISAFMRQDRIGYALAIALKVGWVFVSAAGGVTGHVEGAWTTVVIWGVFAGLTLLESGRPEPLQTHDVTVIDNEGST
jgi:hypothetical protein